MRGPACLADPCLYAPLGAWALQNGGGRPKSKVVVANKVVVVSSSTPPSGAGLLQVVVQCTADVRHTLEGHSPTTRSLGCG